MTVFRPTRDALVATLTIIAGAECVAAPLPPVPLGSETIELELIFTGFAGTAPTEVSGCGDGSNRLFVTTVDGQFYVIQPGAGAATLFLDTDNPDTATNSFRYGSLGSAFHTDYANVGQPGFGRFYTLSTEVSSAATADFGEGSNHAEVIIEWQVDAGDPNVIDVSTKREIMRINQPALDHNVSDLAFDSSGMLYIGSGDGKNDPIGVVDGSANGQDIETVLSKVLRIDPLGLVGATSANGAYSIPNDNPFVGLPGIDEIYAYGLRMPYRLSWDAPTSTMYVGEIGQLTIEEINVLVNGGNYGWNLKEGSFLYDPVTQTVMPDPAPDPNLIPPLVEYDHDSGRSIVGGHIYRGSLMPNLVGKMILADFQGPFDYAQSQPKIFILDVGTGDIEQVNISGSGAPMPQLLYHVGVGDDGEFYISGGNRNRSINYIFRLTAPPVVCAGDLDNDGDTDVLDFGIFSSNFGMTVPIGTGGDLDNDTDVDVFDFGLFVLDFGCTP